MENNFIDWNDLCPVGKLGGNLILFIMEDDIGKNNPMSVQANISIRRFDEVQPLQQYLKFNPFVDVDYKNKDVRYMYHDIIYRKFSQESIINMIKEFSKKYEQQV